MDFDSILDQPSSMTGDILQDATDLESKYVHHPPCHSLSPRSKRANPQVSSVRGIKKDTTTDDYMVFSRVGSWVKKKLLRSGRNWGFMKDGRGFSLRTSKLQERKAGKFIIHSFFPTQQGRKADGVEHSITPKSSLN